MSETLTDALDPERVLWEERVPGWRSLVRGIATWQYTACHRYRRRRKCVHAFLQL